MSNNTKSIARCYVRVSLTRTGEEKESPETQRRDIAAWCERHGYMPEWYLDAEGYQSGRTADRPEFQRLLADLEAAPTGAVVFWKVSRLARNAELAQRIHRLCQGHGYHLAFVANNLDFNFASGDPFQLSMAKLIFGVLADVAEFLSAEISANVRANVRRMKADGKFFGKPPVGTERREDGTLVPDPETVPAIRRLYELYAAGGHSAYAVAERLNEEGLQIGWGNGEPDDWTSQRVRRTLLQWHTYAGHVVDGSAGDGDNVEVVSARAWAPIIDLNLIHAAREVYAERSHDGGHRPAQEYLLSGILQCAYCGGGLAGHSQQRESGVYSYYTHYGEVCDVGGTLYVGETDETILDTIARLDYDRVADQIRVAAERQIVDRTIQESQSAEAERLAELEEQYDGLLDLAGRLDSDRIYKKIVAIEAEMENLQNKLAEPDHSPLPAEVLEELRSMPTWIHAASIHEQRRIVSLLCSRIDADLEERQLRIVFREEWRPYFDDVAVTLPAQKVYAGDELRALRKAVGWSQSRMGEYVGVTKGAVWKWEREESAIAGREYRRRLRSLAIEHLPEIAEAFWR